MERWPLWQAISSGVLQADNGRISEAQMRPCHQPCLGFSAVARWPIRGTQGNGQSGAPKGGKGGKEGKEGRGGAKKGSAPA